MNRFVLAGALLLLTAGSAMAEMSRWMLPEDLDRHIARKLTGGVHYPNVIDCGAINGLAYLRIATTTHKGVPPYFEWRWHLGPTASLDADIAALPVEKKPELAFRVVSQKSFDLGGQSVTCALIQR